jgi:hypothetical protein
MKKTTTKTEGVLNAYRVLSTAKYSKMDDADKIKVWKIARTLKPVADKFEDDSKDAAEKFKPSEDFDEKLQKAQEYERIAKEPDVDASKLPISASEYSEFVKEFQNYNKLVNNAIKEFADKDVEIEFEQLSEDAFGKLMASNEWDMSQVVFLDGIVTE